MGTRGVSEWGLMKRLPLEWTCGCQGGGGGEGGGAGGGEGRGGGGGGGGGSGMDWEIGVSRCKLLNLEWISNKVLLEHRKLYPISWDRP